MTGPASLHIESWAGKPSQPEDAFLAALAEMARRDGSRLCRRLSNEIERLSPSRNRWMPRRQPSVAHLDRCLSRGPKETAYLRGSVAAMKQSLGWERGPTSRALGDFNRRHAFCTIVGPNARVPSDTMKAGLMIVDGGTHYPSHAHAADEVYLTLSGEAVFHVAPNRPGEPPHGRFLPIPSWSAHAMWTGRGSVLLIWAWTGDIDGGYRIGSLSPRP